MAKPDKIVRRNARPPSRTMQTPAAPAPVLPTLPLPAASTPSGTDLPSGSAALRAFTLLEEIVRAERPATLDELVRGSGLSKPTAFRLLALLERAGLLRREPVGPRYAVGPRLADFALGVLRSAPQRAGRHAILQGLVETIGETCNLAVLDGHEVIYLDRVETHWPLRLHLKTGSRVPIHCSSSGKLFLSQLPRAAWEKLLPHGPLKRLTANTLTDRDTLAQELARIRAEGVGVDDEEFLAGIVCLSVPVVDAGGKMFAAVALQAPVARLSLQDCHRHLPALRQAALALAKTFQQADDETTNSLPEPRERSSRHAGKRRCRVRPSARDKG